MKFPQVERKLEEIRFEQHSVSSAINRLVLVDKAPESSMYFDKLARKSSNIDLSKIEVNTVYTYARSFIKAGLTN